jgi:KDO2-lipid IV(A) lauroyltransferase
MKAKCADKSKTRFWASEQLTLIKLKSLSKIIGLLISGFTQLTRTKRKILIKNIGKTILYFSKKTRLRAIKNISNAMPDLSLKEASDLAFDAYGNCAYGVAESFWLTEIEPEIFCDEDTLRILQSGEGACIATMHMGCYEAVPLAITKFSSKSVTLTNIPSFLEDSMDFYSTANITAINKKSVNAFSKLLKNSASNAYISLHCDLYANQIDVTFFGKKTKAPAGIALLAKMNRKPLLLAYAIYQGDGHVQVFFETLYVNQKMTGTSLSENLSEKPTTKSITQENEPTVEQIMSKIYQRFEQVIRQYPNQWYWSYNRWKN